MTSLVDHEPARWLAHARIDKFTAADERDAMHVFFPKRARIVDEADKRGQLHRVPTALVPKIELAHYRELGILPYKVTEAEGNVLTTAGITRMLNLTINAGATQAFDHTHTRILVGDGGGSVPTGAAGDTDLVAAVAAANRYGQMADTSYPSVATNVLTTVATFATGNGNFEWREWGIDQATASGATAATAPLLNHKGVDLGLKTSAASWAFTTTITVS